MTEQGCLEAQELLQRATDAAVIMADLAGGNYNTDRRPHYRRELAGKLDGLERFCREQREILEASLEPGAITQVSKTPSPPRLATASELPKDSGGWRAR